MLLQAKMSETVVKSHTVWIRLFLYVVCVAQGMELLLKWKTNTVGLLIRIACFVKKEKHILVLKAADLN